MGAAVVGATIQGTVSFDGPSLEFNLGATPRAGPSPILGMSVSGRRRPGPRIKQGSAPGRGLPTGTGPEDIVADFCCSDAASQSATDSTADKALSDFSLIFTPSPGGGALVSPSWSMRPCLGSDDEDIVFGGDDAVVADGAVGVDEVVVADGAVGVDDVVVADDGGGGATLASQPARPCSSSSGYLIASSSWHDFTRMMTATSHRAPEKNDDIMWMDTVYLDEEREVFPAVSEKTVFTSFPALPPTATPSSFAAATTPAAVNTSTATTRPATSTESLPPLVSLPPSSTTDDNHIITPTEETDVGALFYTAEQNATDTVPERLSTPREADFNKIETNRKASLDKPNTASCGPEESLAAGAVHSTEKSAATPTNTPSDAWIDNVPDTLVIDVSSPSASPEVEVNLDESCPAVPIVEAVNSRPKLPECWVVLERLHKNIRPRRSCPHHCVICLQRFVSSLALLDHKKSHFD